MTSSHQHSVRILRALCALISVLVSFLPSAPTPAFAQAATEYPTPTAIPQLESITPGPDGALWFTESRGNKIGRITTAGQITEFPLPTANSGPNGIAAGSDGALWFTEYLTNKIGRITTTGSVTEFAIPTPNRRPIGISAGSDGALWFTQYGTGNFREVNYIGRITIGGSITMYPLTGDYNTPRVITAGPDGALWFTNGIATIGRITTGGSITIFPLPGNRETKALTSGPDGALWYADYSNTIGRVTTGGVVTHEFTVAPGATLARGISAITTGPDGALWFTEEVANKVGRITTGGIVTEFSMPPLTGPYLGITTGSDGAVWFTDAGNSIWRLPVPGGTLGGKNIGIIPGGQSPTTIIWDSGTLQTGYLVARYLPGFVLLPPGVQPTVATSVQDNAPATAPAGTLYCYIVGRMVGSPPSLAGVSNFACELANTRSGTGAPQNLTLRVTQSGNAALTWSAPQGGQDGFRIVSMSGSTINLGPTSGSQTIPLPSFDCFMVLAMRTGLATGNTDIVCGLAGVSNLGP